ncbi:MAG: CvpA family protein [Alphaproteobacteria bacterium]
MFDTLAIVVLSLFAVSGLMRGWLIVLGQMVCWLLSLLVALMAGSYLTDYVMNDLAIGASIGKNYAGAIELASTIFMFGIGLILTAGFVRGSAMYHRENSQLELGDKIVGFFFGVAQGGAVLVLIYAIAFALVGQKPNNFLSHATASQYLDPMTREIIKTITPELSGKERYKSLIQIFSGEGVMINNMTDNVTTDLTDNVTTNLTEQITDLIAPKQ